MDLDLLKMKATDASKRRKITYPITQRHIPKKENHKKELFNGFCYFKLNYRMFRPQFGSLQATTLHTKQKLQL